MSNNNCIESLSKAGPHEKRYLKKVYFCQDFYFYPVLIQTLTNNISKHFSLAIIGLGAGCFFLSNILLKEILDEQQYGQYSIVITYFSMIFIFGILGMEQIFLRYSNRIETNHIETQQFQVRLICRTILISSTLSAVFFKVYFGGQFSVNPILLYFASISMVALLYLFNIFRLNNDFVFAQFLANAWRLILLVLAGVFFLLKLANLELLLNLIMCGMTAIFLLATFVFFRRISFIYNEQHSPKDIVSASLQFFISITTFSLLTFGDRFVIQSKFGFEQFGNYFYLTNFFLAPFSILQNYIGFKQLIFFKNNFTLEAFESFNKKVVLFGTLFAGILFAISMGFKQLNWIHFDFNQYTVAIILLLLLGIVRLYSSAITSAFEAKTNIDSLKKANLIFIVIALTLISFAALFFNTLELIILTVTLIWLVRTLVYKQILVKQVGNDQKIKTN